MSSSLATWMFALTVSVCTIIVTAAAGAPILHLAAAGLICLALAMFAIRDHHALLAAGASMSEIGSSTARHTGLVWAWGALAILVPYAFILGAKWPEWWQFFLGFAFAAVASLVFANMLKRDSAAGAVDPSIMAIGRILVIVQLIGMIAALISMFVDGKFPRDAHVADWAGCNVFFFGALAIAAISIDALWFQPRK